MFTYKFFIAKNGKLALRIRNNNKKTEIGLNYKMTQEELENSLAQLAGRRRAGTPRLKSQLSHYTSVLSILADQLITEERIDEDVMVIRRLVEERFGLVRFVETKQEGKFVKHFRDFINGKSNKRTKEIYKQTLDRIADFDSEVHKKDFEQIDLRWLTDFETFCARTAGKNARNIHLRNIRAVFNNAIDYEITSSYPFRRFKIRPEATRKRSLSYDNLRKVLNAAGLEDWEEKYLDFFKLTFMLIGINVIDLCNLVEITDGRINYVRAKTHKPYSIKVEPEAVELIEKHKGKKRLLDFTDTYSSYRHFYNNLTKGLNSIKAKLGLSELTTYWARHTWATIAASLDIPKETIAAALGHGGHTVTDIYIDFDMRKVDEANRRVLDWVLYGKR